MNALFLFFFAVQYVAAPITATVSASEKTPLLSMRAGMRPLAHLCGDAEDEEESDVRRNPSCM